MSGSSKFFFIVSGIVSIILGIFLLLNPVINLMAFAWLFSIIFFVSAHYLIERMTGMTIFDFLKNRRQEAKKVKEGN